MKVFTAEEMRAFDRTAIEEYGIPSLVLMENAALRAVEFLEARFVPLAGKQIAIFCGKGNNGGDGFAIARHLLGTGAGVTVIVAADPAGLKGDALINFEALQKAIEPRHIIQLTGKGSAVSAAQRESIRTANLALDALLGTGFHGTLRNPLTAQALKLLATVQGARIAIDLPSGLNADDGQAIPELIKADYTVTFAAPKRGFFVGDGLHSCGELWVGSIGTAPSQMEAAATNCELLTPETVQRILPRRERDAHKGDAGRALIIGGSSGMSGAPCLASRAALKIGAGLCITCLPEKVQPIFAGAVLEATSHGLACDENGCFTESAANALPDLWKGVNVVALGPGLSRSEGALNFARRVVRQCPVPLIIDADGLYALRAIASEVKKRKAPTILTPHPGEMAELLGTDTKAVQSDRHVAVARCAEEYGAIVLLKGACSLVAIPDGQIYINPTGNSGMATGGSGDVLAGTIAGLLAQLKEATDATLLGVYLHGLAGDLAFIERGNGLIAGDIADHLPSSILKLEKCYLQDINARLKRVL